MGRPIPDVPTFERAAPEPPEWLSLDGRELWAKIAPGLERLDLLKPEDYSTLIAYCECWATYREALATIRRDGLTAENPKTGVLHKHPALFALETANTQLLRFAQEFGLTPAAEIALARPPKAELGEDPFAGGAVETGT
jgi:P27 family predicted phage terminase small subunit